MGGIAGLVEGLRARSGEESFLDRLDDFRGRLIASLAVFGVATAIGFYLSVTFDVLGIFTAPIQPFLGGERLKYLSPTDPFFITLKLAFCIGFVLSLPYLLAQLWKLFSPLMLPEEKRFVAPTLVSGVLLFVVGAVFCYVLVIPLMLQFTMGFQTASLEQSIVIGEYLTVVLRLLFAFGIAFELPIAIVLLTALGVVTPEFLAARRRHAIAILTVASAIVTPPDISSQILLIGPVWLLYEISIVLSRGMLARRSRAEVQDTPVGA
jgi:sec-independent protein translocase protein TatC